MGTALIESIVRDALRIVAPPPKLTVSEWSDCYRMLSSESSAEPGRWRTDRAPYQRGIMDACSDSMTREVVVMSSAQIGKSEFCLNVIGYYVHLDPAPMLLLQPTLEMAEAFSKDRMAPMVRDTKELSCRIADAKSRDSGNTMLHKKFPGGHITMTGANSPSSLASRPIRIVLCDEVDRYPASAGTEGDPVMLARKRTATFWNRKVVLTSTPTIRGLSRIEAAYMGSDQRRYFVPCPVCGEKQTLKWSSLKWDEDNPESTAYQCEHCGAMIEEQNKQRMLHAGEWVASQKFAGVAGFHLNELYSPWRRWADIVRDFIEANKGGPEMLKVWVNTSLGETWEEQGDAIEPVGLMARLESYDEIPRHLARTAGVDVQKDRLEVTVVDWGNGEEAWTMDHFIIPGDTAQPEVWERLAGEVAHWAPEAMAIDSGYNASLVYAFCEKRKWAYAVKGRPGTGVPIVEDERARRQRLRRQRKKGITVHMVGDDQAKALIYSRLKLTAVGPGYIHFPASPSFDDEYFAQLTAEKLIMKVRNGRHVFEWIQTRPRNEALDCWKYSLAALRLSGISLSARASSRRTVPDQMVSITGPFSLAGWKRGA